MKSGCTLLENQIIGIQNYAQRSLYALLCRADLRWCLASSHRCHINHAALNHAPLMLLSLPQGS